MVRIVDVRERTVSLRSEIQNAWISFQEMDTSLVAVISDVVRGGTPVVGYGFGSNGRYSQGGLLRNRFFPRLLAADPADYAAGDDLTIDPERAWSIVMRNEKPGGHGERSVAVGVLDMALWDLAAKLQGVPLVRMLSDRYGDGRPDDSVFVYAAGGYYSPGRPIADLQDEMRQYLDAGYTHVKLKIGLGSLADDMRRIEAVIAVVGAADHVAVDANARFDVATALAYAVAMEPLGLWWYEEPVDPLDYEGLRQVREAYGGRVATGENLFSVTAWIPLATSSRSIPR
jgi:D(-)-tartrate dehydratase